MEENDVPVKLAEAFRVRLNITPFEIRTLKVLF